MEELGYHELARSALSFVLEDESWPVFLAWARTQAVSAEAMAWLEAGPDLEQVRREYLQHSPDPYWRAVGNS